MTDLVESFSGIRGVYGESLNETLAKKYASAFLQWLNKKNPKIVIGRDTRESGIKLSQAFIEVLTSNGCDVIDVGISSTPATENAVRHFSADAGVVITASHNPPEYNGWKLLRKDGAILAADDAEKVIDLAHKQKYENDTDSRQAQDKHQENIQAYTDFCLEIIGKDGIEQIKKLNPTILFDCGGGAIIPFVKPIAETVGINMIMINDEPGKFNRPIEPTPETLAYLSQEIKKHNADFAAGFDADADRAEFVLPNGTMVSGQHALAIAVDEVLANLDAPQEQTVVVNDATSDIIHDISNKHGSKVQEVEVGEVNVVDTMKKLNSEVGGEGSSGGSIISPQTCRDGMLSTLIIARHLAQANKTLQQVIKKLPRYYTLNENIKTTPKQGLRKLLEDHFSDDDKISTITKTGDEFGGIKIRFKDNAWLWYRPSRTEPGLVRVYAESNNEMRAQEILAKGTKLLNSI
jgi:phosphomannomutase